MSAHSPGQAPLSGRDGPLSGRRSALRTDGPLRRSETSASTRADAPGPKPRRPSIPASRRYWTSRGNWSIDRWRRRARSSAAAYSSSASTAESAASMSSASTPLALELPAERGGRKVAPTLAGFHPVRGERGVVDQTGRLEPIQHRLRHRVGHLLGGQRLRKLVPGSGPGRELAQHDGAGEAFWIGVRLGIPIILGFASGRCRLFRRSRSNSAARGESGGAAAGLCRRRIDRHALGGQPGPSFVDGSQGQNSTSPVTGSTPAGTST